MTKTRMRRRMRGVEEVRGSLVAQHIATHTTNYTNDAEEKCRATHPTRIHTLDHKTLTIG